MEEFQRQVLYRLVFAHVFDQAERYYHEADPADLRADPLRGLAIDPLVLQDPEAAETVKDAADDALGRRRPRW